MGKFTAYKIALKGISEGKHEYKFHLGKDFFQNMENGDIHDADLQATLTVDCIHDEYKLDLHVEGEVTLLCDRCLDYLQWPINQDYSLIVKYGEDYNDDSDDVLVIPYSDNDLNVAYTIYDTVVLGIPIKHVHPLGKCNRQMSALLKRHQVSGHGDEDSELEQTLIDEIDNMDAEAEKVADPRWDALKGLKTDSED